MMSGAAAGAAVAVHKSTGKSHEEWLAIAAEKVQPYTDSLNQQLDAALANSDSSRINNVLDSAIAARMLKGGGAVKRQAEAMATRQLKEAIASEDAKQIKGALVAAHRLCATEVPEFSLAIQKYKEVRKLPPGWDVAKMALNREGGRMVAKLEVDSKAVQAKFQRLLDLTFRRVYTRDRLGEPVPEKLELLGVSAVTNDESWGDYMMRRETIKREIEADRTDFTRYPVETMERKNLADYGGELRQGENCDSIAKSLAEDFSEPLLSDVNEVFLFHGTSRDAADKITTNDFKISLSGSNAGTLYGRGIYFAENSTKSDEYTRPEPDGTRYLLVCRATLGRVKYIPDKDTDPRACEDACLKGIYHSILGDRKLARGTFREFIVFDEEQVYPNYIISYRRVNAKVDEQRLLNVTCPPGASPGTTLRVQAPDGTLLNIMVPAGIGPGQTFKAQY
jgi:hypothetical protein